MEGLLEMNSKERERIKTLIRLEEKTLNQKLAAEQLGIESRRTGNIGHRQRVGRGCRR